MVKPWLGKRQRLQGVKGTADTIDTMNRTLGSLLLWAGWFLASAVICSLLRIAAELWSTRILSGGMAQSFASAIVGVIALVVTLEITAAYTGEPTA
ncbi:MAG: hypothetical protein NVSMB31_02480 [Vulcanimicrobiaceae bacterium]